MKEFFKKLFNMKSEKISDDINHTPKEVITKYYAISNLRISLKKRNSRDYDPYVEINRGISDNDNPNDRWKNFITWVEGDSPSYNIPMGCKGSEGSFGIMRCSLLGYKICKTYNKFEDGKFIEIVDELPKGCICSEYKSSGGDEEEHF